jgi:hypothetical protein
MVRSHWELVWTRKRVELPRSIWRSSSLESRTSCGRVYETYQTKTSFARIKTIAALKTASSAQAYQTHYTYWWMVFFIFRGMG